MRILNVIRSVNPVHGGPAEGLRQSIRATAALGHVEEVLTLDAPADPWLGAFPVPTHAIGPVAANYGYAGRLVPWLRRHARRYDAVVVHGLWQYHGLAVWRALRDGNVPYFVFCHGMLDPWFKREYPLKHLKKWLYWPWGEYRVLRDANAVLFTAEEESILARQSFWLYRARHAVVGYGLQLDAVAHAARAETFHDAFPATRGKRIVLFLGRIHPKKGCDLLIEAFARLAQREPALHLVMAGPDQVGARRGLEALAAQLGVAERISWCGMLGGEMKWAAFRAAEVFALPSHQENFGIAVAEALAVGLPVLISQRVNIWREIVADAAGFAEPDTLAGTAALLERWLALSSEQRATMREAAVLCYRRHFHIEAAARRLMATIEPHTRDAGAPRPLLA
jgi:glycosyltransferase involved in cell wall biosynthesis